MVRVNCPYCEYGYEIDPPENIMRILTEPDLPHEDYHLWMDRLVHVVTKRYHEAISAHIRVRHQDQAMLYFNLSFNDKEKEAIHDPA